MEWNLTLDGGQLNFLHDLVAEYMKQAEKPSLASVYPTGIALEVYDALQGALPKERTA